MDNATHTYRRDSNGELIRGRWEKTGLFQTERNGLFSFNYLAENFKLVSADPYPVPEPPPTTLPVSLDDYAMIARGYLCLSEASFKQAVKVLRPLILAGYQG